MPQDLPQFDTTKLPLGESGWEQFVAWAAARDDTIESRWLELKSDVDPTTRTGAAKVARFILAAGNRDPLESRRALGGHAVLLLGVGPGQMKGLPPVENLTIRQLVQPFLGPDGPAWDVVRVPGSDGQVLAVVVSPPNEGDPIYIARKNGDDIRDGQIYVRGDGASAMNTSPDFDRLLRRSQPAATGPELGVSLIGRPYRYTYDPAVVDDLLDSIRGDFLRKLPAKRNPGSAPYGLAKIAAKQAELERLSALTALSKPETRTEDEYREQVEEYLDDCRSDFPVLVDRLIGALAEPVAVVVTNRNERFLSSVEVTLHVEGDIDAIESEELEDVSYADIFRSAPRKWGPTMIDVGVGQVALSAYNFPMLQRDPRPSKPSSWSDFKNGGSIDGRVGFKEIRPRHEVQEKTRKCFVIRDKEMTNVRVTWTATVEDVHEVFEGSFDVPAAPAIDITDDLRNAWSAAMA